MSVREELATIRRDLESLGDSATADFLQGFFKTGPGEYGEGDLFRGIRVPKTRELARRYRDVSTETLVRLLASPYHEDRLLSLFVLVHKYKRGDDATKRRIFDLYLSKTDRINSWDLVDGSAPHIVGDYLLDRETDLLEEFAGSDSLWERRIAIVATYRFIQNYSYAPTLDVAQLLLDDREDLIHKATGWMLREVGKRDMALEEAFIREHYDRMPRTMLRYAIERFPPEKRRAYIDGTFECV